MNSKGSSWPRTVEVLSALQSLIVIIGVIVGGLWTYHTFNAQLHVENAQAQLKKLHRELEREPRIEMHFKIVQQIPEGKRRLLIMELVIENKGTKEGYLFFGKQPIHLYEAIVIPSGDTGLRRLRTALIRGSAGSYTGGSTIQPNSVGTFQFMTYVEGPGTYAFEYSTPIAETPDSAAAKGASDTAVLGARWGTMNYFHIP